MNTCLCELDLNSFRCLLEFLFLILERLRYRILEARDLNDFEKSCIKMLQIRFGTNTVLLGLQKAFDQQETPMPNFSLRLPNSLQRDIKHAATLENISINQFIMLAVAEKITALKQADRLGFYRAQPPVSKEAFLEILGKVPSVKARDDD